MPLLVFSPGLGVPVFAYSAQFEELASKGYAVAAVQHPYEGVSMRLPNNSSLAPIANGRVATKEMGDVNALATDIRTVLDELETQRKGLRLPSFSRIGVFGHSIGGVVALRVCQLDHRVSACLSEDGMDQGKPFLSLPSKALDQPFLVLAESNPGLSDEMLASTHMSRAEFVEEEMQPHGVARQMYGSAKNGSYLVIIATPDVDHMSFTDAPLFSAASAQHLQTFHAITDTVKIFFDSALRGKPDRLSELRSPVVAVMRFRGDQKQ